jgi:ribose transport system substrate-binding protein
MYFYNKTRLAIAGLAVCGLALTAGCSAQGGGSDVGGGSKTVVFLNPQPTNPFWQHVEDGLKVAAGKNGIELKVLGSGADVGGQVNVMQSAVTSKPAGIIVGALDSKGIVPGVEAANTAGIPVVAVDTAIAGGNVASLVQTDNVAAAALAGSFIGKKIDPGASVLIVDGDLASETANNRHDGAVKGLDKAGKFDITSQSGYWDTTKAMDAVQNALTANPKIAAIFNASDQMTQGTLAAIGNRSDLVITGFDGDPSVLQEIKSGRVAADVAQDPCEIGAQGLAQMAAVLNGKKPAKLVKVDAILIDKSNVEQHLGDGGCKK